MFEDRFALFDPIETIDIRMSEDSIDTSPRDLESESIETIRKNFPEAWIFDSIDNETLGYLTFFLL